MGLLGGDLGGLVNGRVSLCGVSWFFLFVFVVLELIGEDMLVLGLFFK